MRQFDYSYLADRTWDNEIMSYISKIHEYKGKQELFLRQRPVELNRLIEIAKIQSTEASNRIEGIITTNARLKQLVADKTTPKNRDEEEILGYRNVLNLVHENYEVLLHISSEAGFRIKGRTSLFACLLYDIVLQVPSSHKRRCYERLHSQSSDHQKGAGGVPFCLHMENRYIDNRRQPFLQMRLQSHIHFLHTALYRKEMQV
jgi:hypothetical protein